MPKTKYYAICYNGVENIVTKWDDCRKIVKGLSNCSYKSFDNRADAEIFIKEEQSRRINMTSNQLEKDKRSIIAFTDGSCYKNNGGYGLIITNHNGTTVTNQSVQIDGKATNNIAELQAILAVLEIFKLEYNTTKKYIIVSDSQYAIFSSIHPSILKEEQANYELIKKIHTLLGGMTKVYFQHVDAHKVSNEYIYVMNNKVDLLAKQAINIA